MMDNVLCLQLNDVKAVFENSLGSVKQHHNVPLFRHIKGNLLHFTLDLIKRKVDRSIEIGIDPSVCDHVLRTVYGLPCAHELLQYGRENRPIPVEAVDDHWTKLTILPNSSNHTDVDNTAEIIMFKKLYLKSTEDEKTVLLMKLKDIAMPTTTSLREPTHVVPKGRPRGSKRKLSQKELKHEKSTKRELSGFEYAKSVEVQQLTTIISDKLSQVLKSRKGSMKKKKVDPPKYELTLYLLYILGFLHPFVNDIQAVKSNGNCGYRCIVEHLGWTDNANNWKLVRTNLRADLERYKSRYDEVFGNWFYEDCRLTLECNYSLCDRSHWMVMPDMGYLIASAYNCVVILISDAQCLTFLPHADPPSEGSIPRVFPVAFVHNCHFIRLLLKDNAPIPPVASMWERFRTEKVGIWIQNYVNKIAKFMDMKLQKVATLDFPITLD